MDPTFQNSTPSEAVFAAYTFYDGGVDTSTEAFPGYSSKTLPTQGSDQVDLVPFSFMKTIKTVVLRFLTQAISEIRKELCFGCQIDHPSQIQHECLYPAQEYFFLTHQKELYDRLFNLRFTEAVRRVLSQHHDLIYPHSHSVVLGITEAFLYDLLHVKNIESEILVQSDRLCNELDPQLLKDAEQFWLGKQEPEEKEWTAEKLD